MVRDSNIDQCQGHDWSAEYRHIYISHMISSSKEVTGRLSVVRDIIGRFDVD